MVDSFLHEYTANVFLLGLLIWREAAGEPYEGKVAVGYTVLNRADHPKWWGNDPYSVITKPMQYSSITAKGDPMTVRWPSIDRDTVDGRIFVQCLDIATRVFNREVKNPFPGADSYYSDTIEKPKWADDTKFVGKIGHHSFYNLDGDPGESTAA